MCVCVNTHVCMYISACMLQYLPWSSLPLEWTDKETNDVLEASWNFL